MTTIKTVMVLVCVGLMAFIMPAAAQQNIVAIEDVTLSSGNTQDVPIRLLNSTGVGGAQVTLTFDQSIVNVTNAVEGDFTGIFNPDYSDVNNGILRVTCMEFGTDLTGDLTIATITLDAVGMSGSCDLGLYAELTTSGGGAVSSSVGNGTFTVSTGPPAPTITTYTINPTTIIPPQTTSIDVAFSETVSYRIAIEKGGATIYDWTGTATNPTAKVWDGTNTTGAQVPGGVYTVNVTGTNTTTGLSVTDTTKTIMVIPPPPVMTLIEVAPQQTATLNITETQQFTATAKDQYGNTMPAIIFTWSSSNTATGVINQNGLFTANAPGTTTVKAANGSINGTASVVVIFKADYTLFLATGWNFVSIPKKLAAGNNTVEDVFGDVNRSSHSIFLYNTSTAEWNVMNLTDEVKPLDGIWIYSAESKAIPVTFDNDPLRTPPTKMLCNGWNAIGLSDTMPTSANDALSPVEDEWTFLIGFNAINQQYQTTIINNNHDGDERDEGNPMNSGLGYWVYMKEDGELAGLSV
ncbi:MAG: hypothetical protein ANIMEMIM_00266 [Candidatus Argoarchaeum ethanivorans]|uniref:BIG2 domain-containing protein n=1 Tax=Candidatus Argoarchaeum ethanivorans TaxID=2608793 RepID=A0A811T8F4_9EURY|nr:MAG: hypothetical protein ANIMEMIM_00266 [Candidatus Argoarchaeum ethanivorans]